ncbi:MAG TPA: hypothetical protein GXX37_02655 [Clostridiaceae bacterium]|nr:hypothetical protein [Clostridiaceae bacterium]
MGYKRKDLKLNSANKTNSLNNGKTYDYQSYRKKRINRVNEKVRYNDASNDDNDDNKENRQLSKNRKLKRRRKITSLIIIAFIIIYIPSLFNWFYGDSVATAIIYNGKIEDSINTDALIVRNEILIEAPFDGEYIPLYEEGEKVSANSVIATVLKESASGLLNEVNEINKKIIFAKQEKNKISGIFNSDIEKLDNEICNKINLLVDDINNNRMDGIVKLKKEIDDIIQKKAMIIGSDQNNDVYIQSLIEQKEDLEKQMSQSIEEKSIPFSGIVSYSVDGYEDILKPDAIKDITPEFFTRLMADKEQDIDRLSRKTSAGKPFAKVAIELEFYLVICKDAENLGFLDVGDVILIRINGTNKVVQGTVDYISEEQSGKKIVSFKIDKYANELSDLRKLNIDIIKSTYEGLMVPLKSLLNINKTNMTANIALVKANYASIREVRIEGYNSEYAIISSLNPEKGVSLYDTYVTNPKNIEDGQVISQ